MNKLIISPSPHIYTSKTTRSLMSDVLIALSPLVVVSILFYGWSALMILAVSLITSLGVEYLINRFLLKSKCTISDGSAAVTAILLALNLPWSSPWWMVMIGAVVAVGVAKMTFGGIGQNLFNPALVGRVFLLVSFPAIMTKWANPEGFITLDAFSGATPLGVVKGGIAQGISLPEIIADNGFSLSEMFFINVGGSVGEASALAILLGFIYMVVRKVIKPYITLSLLGTVALVSTIFNLIDPSSFTGPGFNLLTGGVLLGAVFMATDYVTSPMSNLGGIIFGAGIGLLTIFIRYFGAYPEGMSFAILIMNAVVPIINKFVKPRKFGRA